MRSVPFAALLCLVTAACTGDDAPRASTGDVPSESPTGVEGEAPPSEPQDVTIVAVDYAYSEAPAELEAGVINLTFENKGTVYHEVALTGIGDTPLEQFFEELGGWGDPFPDYVDQGVVPSFVSTEGGSTAEGTFTLSEGRYALYCAVTETAEGDEEEVHYKLGMFREIVVSGGVSDPELPEADGSITATDYAFDVDLEAGDRTVNFVNEGPEQMHLSTVELYPAGVSEEEARRAYATYLEPGPLPKGVPSPSGLGFSGIFSPGLGSTFELFKGEFESGRTYLFACFVSDREGGKPHTKAYGMYEVVTIE